MLKFVRRLDASAGLHDGIRAIFTVHFQTGLSNGTGRCMLCQRHQPEAASSAHTGETWNGEAITMSVTQEIGHLVLNVSDVERSTKFYRDVVGFQLARYRPNGTGAFLTCGVVHHNLALFKAPEGAQPAQKGQIGLN